MIKPKYLVKDLGGREWYFDSARNVSIFLWGKRANDYAVYQLQVKLPYEIASIEQELCNREIAMHLDKHCFLTPKSTK